MKTLNMKYNRVYQTTVLVAGLAAMLPILPAIALMHLVAALDHPE